MNLLLVLLSVMHLSNVECGHHAALVESVQLAKLLCVPAREMISSVTHVTNMGFCSRTPAEVLQCQECAARTHSCSASVFHAGTQRTSGEVYWPASLSLTYRPWSMGRDEESASQLGRPCPCDPFWAQFMRQLEETPAFKTDWSLRKTVTAVFCVDSLVQLSRHSSALPVLNQHEVSARTRSRALRRFGPCLLNLARDVLATTTQDTVDGNILRWLSNREDARASARTGLCAPFISFLWSWQALAAQRQVLYKFIQSE